MKKIRAIIKRAIDIIGSMVGIIIFSPVFIVITVLIYIKLGYPIFFTQERAGKNEKMFKIIKFRTMLDDKDQYGNLLPDELRLTKFGNILRSTSLDEIPQFINVLKGDMSLVGPRPFVIEDIPIYSKEQLKRHDIKPGITGWAQINGRNSISWNKKIELDIWYLENQSIILDIKILLLTVLKVIKRDGINKSEDIIVEEFNSDN